MPYLIVSVTLVSALALLDAGLRCGGFYDSTRIGWPAWWRRLPARPPSPDPYRQDPPGGWALEVQAGIPRAVSVCLAPLFGVLLAWTVSTAMAFGDLPAAARGTRSLPFVLASLAGCVLHFLLAAGAMAATCEGRGRSALLAAGLGLGLDAALACLPLPCSDHRDDDVHVALFGVITYAALGLALAFSLARHRGLIASESPSAPPREG